MLADLSLQLGFLFPFSSAFLGENTGNLKSVELEMRVKSVSKLIEKTVYLMTPRSTTV